MPLDLLPPLDMSSLLGGMPLPGDVVAAQRLVDAKRQMEQAALTRQLQQQRAADQARQDAIASPSASNYARLFLLDPGARESIKAAHDSLDTETQNLNLKDYSAIRGQLAAGRGDQAQATLQARIDADKAAGRDATDDEQMVDLIAHQPDKALSAVDYHLAAILGPDKWGEAFKPGQENARIGIAQQTADTASAQAAETARHNRADENKPIVMHTPTGDVLVDASGAQSPAPGGRPELPPAVGLKTPGNLDPWNRPILRNPDGSYSTTSSISIGTESGEVLIPTVVDGKRLSNEEAIARYRATGENFGTFDTPAHADAYAQELHNRQDQYVRSSGQLAPTTPARRTPAPTGPVYDQIGTEAQALGASPARVRYLQRLAQVESGGNPKARNGSSTSTFQFHPDTFAAAGGGDINSLKDQTRAALNLANHDEAVLQAVGVEPTDANLYIMHQQGAGGGPALLSAPPDVGAVAALTPVYRNQHTALAAIAGNIGMPYGKKATPAQRAAAEARAAQMTAGEFVGRWQNKWAGGKLTDPVQTGAQPSPGQAPGVRVLYDASQNAPDDVALTHDAVDLAAGKYLRDGTLPTFGGGKIGAANKLAIYNRAAEMAKGLGLSADDVVAGTAGTKALGSALSKSVTMLSQIQGSEQTVLRNMDYAMTLAPKGVGHGPPVWNRFEQFVRGEYAGDPDVTAFDNALHTVADEYAKVMTTSTGSGGAPTSDSARQEAYRRLSKAGTLDQLTNNLTVMRTEMGNRISSLKEVNAGLRTQLRAGPNGAAVAATPAAGADAASSEAPPRRTRDGYLVFTPEQYQRAKAQGIKGKFYDTDGNLRELR